MKFYQPLSLPKVGKVLVCIHNVETKEDAVAMLEKAQPLNAADIQEYEGQKYLHLNSGLGYGNDITFTKDAAEAGSTTSCAGVWK